MYRINRELIGFQQFLAQHGSECFTFSTALVSELYRLIFFVLIDAPYIPFPIPPRSELSADQLLWVDRVDSIVLLFQMAFRSDADRLSFVPYLSFDLFMSDHGIIDIWMYCSARFPSGTTPHIFPSRDTPRPLVSPHPEVSSWLMQVRDPSPLESSVFGDTGPTSTSSPSHRESC